MAKWSARNESWRPDALEMNRSRTHKSDRITNQDLDRVQQKSFRNGSTRALAQESPKKWTDSNLNFLNSFCLCLFFRLCFIKNWSHFIDREFGLRVSRRWRTPKSAISSTAAQNCARTKGGSTFRTFNSPLNSIVPRSRTHRAFIENALRSSLGRHPLLPYFSHNHPYL